MFYELFLYLFYFTIIRLWNVTKRPVIEPVGIWGKRKIHELFMQIDNKVLKLQQKIAENISKWPTYTIDPWTTWFWMVWVHLQADFFFSMNSDWVLSSLPMTIALHKVFLAYLTWMKFLFWHYFLWWPPHSPSNTFLILFCKFSISFLYTKPE